jgi:hypothetical protein
MGLLVQQRWGKEVVVEGYDPINGHEERGLAKPMKCRDKARAIMRN